MPIARPLRALAAGLLALCSGCLTSGFDLEASAGVWAPSIGGDARLASSSGPASGEIDLESDLDLDQDAAPFVRARLGAVGFNAFGSAFQTSQSGSGRLEASFGDLSAGTPVSTDLDLTVAQAAVTFNLVDVGVFRLAPGIGADWIDVELDVQAATQSERVEGEGPVPLVFVEAEVDPPALPLSLLVQVGGMGGTWDEFEGVLLDAQALLRWQVVDWAEVYGGYRLLRFEVDGSTSGQDFTTDVDLSGFLVGAGLRF